MQHDPRCQCRCRCNERLGPRPITESDLKELAEKVADQLRKAKEKTDADV